MSNEAGYIAVSLNLSYDEELLIPLEKYPEFLALVQSLDLLKNGRWSTETSTAVPFKMSEACNPRYVSEEQRAEAQMNTILREEDN